MNKLGNHIKTFVLVLVMGFNFISSEIYAQISQGGEPYSFTHSLDFPSYYEPDASELVFRKDNASKDCNALEFARFLDFDVSLDDQIWQKTIANDGSIIYRLAIQSPEALAIGAYFSDFNIPLGASLFIYSPDQNQLIGAYTHINNHESGFFATEYLLGDKLIIEYREPYAVRGQGYFNVSQILHAYRGFDEVEEEKSFGGSGDCEVNVNCPEGDGKKSQRDAVLRLLIKSGNSGVWCTGSLINNTSEDRTPYVITADHCGKNSSISDHAQWVFYFHYQGWGCANPLTQPSHKTMVGCSEVASSSNAGTLGSDFYLVLISDDIPDNYLPYFLGWNRDGNGSDNGYTMHHPDGDVKKISTYTTVLIDASYATGIPNGYWEVVWSETVSGHGVTEGGSSGSPIFDSEGYIIGTLTGGQASCSEYGLTAPDFYGKLSKHWDQNGSADNQRLMPWLDPLNTGVEKMNGVYMGVDEEELLSDKLFEAIPNPVQDQLTLYFHKNYNGFQVQLSDLSGKVLYESFVNGNQTHSLSLRHLQKGIYIIRVNSAEFVQTIKVVKL